MAEQREAAEVIQSAIYGYSDPFRWEGDEAFPEGVARFIASELAERGLLVTQPSPPPPTFGDDAMQAIKYGERTGVEMVALPRDEAETIVSFFDGECHFDHHGYCQAHTLSDPCPIPALRAALESPRVEALNREETPDA